MTTELLVLEPVDGISQLRLNRSAKRNAINLVMKNGIADALEHWRDDAKVQIVVMSAEGQDFASGSDINELASWTGADHQRLHTNRMWESLRTFPKPIIAAVTGRAWGGGCELAMACDVIVADRTASFAQPEVRLGISPGAGGVQRLFRLVGRSVGMRMVLTGKPLSADDALHIGLVSEVVVSEVLQHAVNIARMIACMDPSAVEAIKQLARHAENLPLEEGLKRERETFLQLCSSEAKKQLMTAFLEKKV